MDNNLTTDLASRQLEMSARWLMAESSSLFITQDLDRYHRLCELVKGKPGKRVLKALLDSPLSLSNLETAARQQKQAHGLAVIVVDHVDTIIPGGAFASRRDSMAFIDNALLELAQSVGVTVISTYAEGPPGRTKVWM